MTDIRTSAVCGKVKRIIRETVASVVVEGEETWPGIRVRIGTEYLSALVALDLLADDMPDAIMDAIRAAAAAGQEINHHTPDRDRIEDRLVTFDFAAEAASAYITRQRDELEAV